MTTKAALFGLICCVTPGMLPGVLHAQERTPQVARAAEAAAAADEAFDDEAEVDTLVVTGTRSYGATIGDIPPEETFSAADVRALGVSSINDLLAELAPQTTSGRGGTPVVLLNGRRISSFSEMRNIPTEAIQRVEVLPEEVALKYGYTADQKVVNVVLRQRFRAKTAELTGAIPTEGGQFSGEVEASSLRLNGDGRVNLALEYSHSDALLESDRDLVSNLSDASYGLTGNVTPGLAGGEIDPALSALAGVRTTLAAVPTAATTGRASLAAFAANANRADVADLTGQRSLLARTDDLTVNAVVNRFIFGDVSATLNVSGAYAESQSLLGLARTRLTVPAGSAFSPFASAVTLSRYRGDLGALEQNARSYSGHVGVTLNGNVSDWRWTVTGNYDHAVSRTLTDRGVDVTGLQARLNALDPTFNPFGALPATDFQVDRARSVTDTANLQAVFNGALLRLPAGDLSTTVKLGVEAAGLDATSLRSGVASNANLSRESGGAQISLDAPIAKAAQGVLPALGDLSVNFNFAYNELSDFGGLTTLGYGLNWSPWRPVSFIVSMTDQEGAPSMSQLGGPLVSTPDVRVFDFVRGTSVDVTRVSGGNPDLRAEDRRTLKVGVNFKPEQISGLTLNANYLRTRVDDPISSFPAATAATEALFPDRFTRDAAGNLTRIDARSVNFAKQESQQIRWGLNYSRQIGKTPPRPAFDPNRPRQFRGEGGPTGQARQPGAQAQGPQAQGPQGQGQPGQPPQSAPPSGATSDRPEGMNLLQGALAPPPRPTQGGAAIAGDTQRQTAQAQATTGQQAPGQGGGDQGFRGPGGQGGGPRGFGGGGFGGGGPGGGAARLQLGLFHTVLLEDKVTLREGTRPLDLLKGDTLNSNGASSRHQVEAQAGLTSRGLGARVTANWQSGTSVNSSNVGSLRFSDLTTVNLRLFANLAAQREWVRKYPFLRGTRVTLGVNNLFNERQTVRDALGATPVNYQPDYLDPLGRSVRLSVRKVFF